MVAGKAGQVAPCRRLQRMGSDPPSARGLPPLPVVPAPLTSASQGLVARSVARTLQLRVYEQASSPHCTRSLMLDSPHLPRTAQVVPGGGKGGRRPPAWEAGFFKLGSVDVALCTASGAQQGRR